MDIIIVILPQIATKKHYILGIEVIKYRIIIVNMSKLKEFLKQNRTAVIVGICSFVLGIAIFGTIAWFVGRSYSNGAKITGGESASATESVESEKASEQDSEKKKSKSKEKNADEDSSEEMDDTEEAEEEAEEFVPTTMVCVPLEDMHLRSNPGSDSADNIATLHTGDKVLWSGESENANGNDYYYVESLSDGTRGYALSDYLVPVYYDYDWHDLPMIETDNATYTYPMMTEDIERLCQKYGDILSYEVIGNSVDGRNIYCMFLGNKNAPHKILVQATIHAREYMNTQLVMKLIEYYCANYKEGFLGDASYSSLLDNVCICVVPMTNPDGVSLVQSGASAINNPDLREVSAQTYTTDVMNLTQRIDSLGDAYWEDHYDDPTFNIMTYLGNVISYDEYLKQWKANANGVDLNNNFDGNWSNVELKSYKSYGSFKGPGPESEPESAALADLARKYDFDMYISYHSKGDVIYYDTKGNDESVSQRSFDLAKLAGAQTGYRYVSNKIAPDNNQGGFGDWVQLKLGKPSITIESGRHRCPLSINEFAPMMLRHRELWAVLANSVADESSKKRGVLVKREEEDKPADTKAVADVSDSGENKLRIASIAASSELIAKSVDGATYYVQNAIDGDITTAWLEGVDGVGEGERISLLLDGKHDISKIVIYEGFMKSKYRYSINGRPTKISLEFDNGKTVTADIKITDPGTSDEPFADPSGTVISFDEPISSESVNITVLSAIAGTKYQDTAISEIEIYGK